MIVAAATTSAIAIFSGLAEAEAAEDRDRVGADAFVQPGRLKVRANRSERTVAVLMVARVIVRMSARVIVSRSVRMAVRVFVNVTVVM